MKPQVSLWQLLCRSFQLSGTTIGGGFVIMAMMEKIYVRRLGWLTEEEMLDITSIAQSMPGAVAVNASLLTGTRLRGLAGAAVSLLGCILPPFGIMCFIGALYSLIRGSETISLFLPGIRIGIGLFLSKIAFSLCRRTLTTRCSRCLFLISLTGMLFLEIRSTWFLLAAGLFSVIQYIGRKKV